MKNIQCVNKFEGFSPYTIEIELTNCCNASCVFCPNSISPRKKEFIDKQKLFKFLKNEKSKKNVNAFNKEFKTFDFPKIVYAGLGEPLLHPDFIEIIEYTKKLGFIVEVVTNGYLLTHDIVDKMIELEVDSLAISLHSINEKIYNDITGLNLYDVLPNVSYALEKFDNTKQKIQIWRIKPLKNMLQEDEKDKKKFSDYISKYHQTIVLGPSEPWSRDMDNFTDCDYVDDDPNGNIWCRKVYYTLNIACTGDIVICCNDFNRISVKLGNVFDDSNLSNNIRESIMNKSIVPDICKECRRWKDNELEEIIKNYGGINE